MRRLRALCRANLTASSPKTLEKQPLERLSVAGRLVAAVSVGLEDRGEGMVLVCVRHAAGVGCVDRGRVGRRGVGRRVGRVEIWRRLRVGGDGGALITTAKTAHGKIGQDGLWN